jgi:uncharacterized protein DUF2537
VQLRAVGERAVFVGHDGLADREVDPRHLRLDDDLTDALHEWARVAAAVRRTAATEDAAAAAVVARRGLQLASRVAAAVGASISYVDPVTGRSRTVDPPELERPARSATAPAEPVPWLTGLTLSGASVVLVLLTMVTLAATLAETHALLALGSNVVVTAGLLPSLWLIHRLPIWRWVAYGVAVALALAWVALPFIML